MLTKADIDWLIDSMKRIFPTKEESTKKFDAVMEKLDTFVGEIKARREEQTIHADQHEKITDRLEVVEKRLSATP